MVKIFSLKNNPVQILSISFALVASASSFAGIGSSLMQSATVLGPGHYEAKIQGDIILNGSGGFNIAPHFRIGILEHYLDAEVFVGTGTTDFQFGAISKYNILPDLDGQVGLSVLFGASYQKDKVANVSSSVGLVTFGFVASKQMPMSFGQLTPYAAFEVESYLAKGKSIAPISLLGGAKFDLTDIPWSFYGELGMNVHQSVWSLNAGVSHNF